MSGIQSQVQEPGSAAVSAGEKKLRNVLLEAPGIFLILEGPEMLITFGNKPLFESWGRDQSIIGKRLLDVLPELKDQAFPRLLQQVYETGKSHMGSEEKAVIVKDGKIIDKYYTYVYQPMIEEDGKTTGVMVMATDITNQVVARKAAEESRSRLQLITDNVPSLVSYINKDLRYDFNNYMYEKWFGQDRSELQGSKLVDVIGEKAYEGVKPYVERALKGEAVHFERLLPYKAGGARYVNIDYIPEIVEGKVLGFFAIINDLSDRKKFEDELEQKVIERTKEIQKANVLLERMNKELSSFAYISSHDLQEPLRKIQMFSKRIEEKNKTF